MIVKPSDRGPEHATVQVVCNEGNAFDILGAVLDAMQVQLGEKSPAVTVQLRDTSVGEAPRASTWSTADLIALWRNKKRPPGHQPWELVCVRDLPCVSVDTEGTIGTVLRLLSLGLGLHLEAADHSFRIAPPELAAGHPALGRRVYRFPKDHVWHGKLPPKQLNPTGACCAYDPTTRLLVIIGEYVNLNVFEDVLEGLGAVCVWQTETEPM